MLLDYFARTFLFFSFDIALITMIAFGYWCIDKGIFKHAAIILLVSMLINVFLKALFQVQALPGLDGYSFPSGHAQNAATFWCYLAYRSHKSWMYLIAITLITGIGFALIHFDFHHLQDVLAGVGFALATIALYHSIYHYYGQSIKKQGILTRILETTLFLLLFLLILPGPLPHHSWIAIFGILGFAIGSMIEDKFIQYTVPERSFHKLATVLPGLAGTFAFYFAIQRLALHPAITYSLSFGLISLWVSLIYPGLVKGITNANRANLRHTRTR